MGHTYFSMHAHIVFSTKGRVEWLTPDIEKEVWAYLATAVRSEECHAHIVGGHRNHVHVLVGMDKHVLVPDLVKEIKRTSSSWMSQRIGRFAWQEGYGAFSVSYSNLKRVDRYIRNQVEHHRKRSWEKEFRGLLVRHCVPFDERYYLD
jgi:REP element-mobilizing transposase RayT